MEFVMALSNFGEIRISLLFYIARSRSWILEFFDNKNFPADNSTGPM